MSRTIKRIPATVSPDGIVTLSEPVELSGPASAVVTIVVEDDEIGAMEPALLSEEDLADWGRQEEDEAWGYLQERISSS